MTDDNTTGDVPVIDLGLSRCDEVAQLGGVDIDDDDDEIGMEDDA